MRGAWIEISFAFIVYLLDASLPMRGAWIEIVTFISLDIYIIVAPHAGSVD